MEPAAAELQQFYSSLRMPVVILAGTEDAIVRTHHHSARLNLQVPFSELWVRQGVGHMLHHAAPDLVARAIARVAAQSARRAGLRFAA